jgi:hypothetical protein
MAARAGFSQSGSSALEPPETMPKPRRHSKASEMSARRREADFCHKPWGSSEKINDSATQRIRFRFVLIAKVNGLEELWKDRSFACGWTHGAVARIPQITSLHSRKS